MAFLRGIHATTEQNPKGKIKDSLYPTQVMKIGDSQCICTVDFSVLEEILKISDMSLYFLNYFLNKLKPQCIVPYQTEIIPSQFKTIRPLCTCQRQYPSAGR